MSLNDLLKFLIPPKNSENASPWRWAVFIAVLVLLANGAAGRGLLWGYGAYAAAQDVKIILELQYADVISGLHKQLCEAKKRGEPTARLEHALEDYQRRYRELTGERYPLSNCRE